MNYIYNIYMHASASNDLFYNEYCLFPVLLCNFILYKIWF